MIELVHHKMKGARRRLPHEINTSLRLILAGPTPLRGGATQKCGAKPPAIIFVWPSPTRAGPPRMKGWEVMIDWGNGTAPTSPTLFLVGTYINSFGFLLLFRLETFFRFILTKTSFLMMSCFKNLSCHLVFFKVLLSISSKNTVAQIPLAQIPLPRVRR